MTLIIDITNFEVKDSGEQFGGKMYYISAKLILTEGEVIIHEQTFTQQHKVFYIMADTMDKIAIQMAAAKKKIEIEMALKIEAAEKKLDMLNKITSIEEEK